MCVAQTDRSDMVISRSATDIPPVPDNRMPILRSRLLPRMLGLLLVIGLLWILVFTGSPVTPDQGVRLAMAIFLLLAGIWLAWSVLALVNTSTADVPAGGTRAPESGVKTGATGDMEASSLQILYEVVSSINTAHGLDDLLTRFLFALKRVFRAPAAAIWVRSTSRRVELAASSGLDESLLLPDRADVRRSLYERAMTEGKIWVDASLNKFERIAGRTFFDRGDVGLVSIPMRYRGKVIGVINLFLESDMVAQVDTLRPLLTSISHHLSIAIERSRNDEESRRHLINDERTRIAHELHDSLAQSLASLRYQVRVLDETLHQGDESTTWQQLERIENSLDEANTELRELIANFRAPVSMRGLVGAIEQIVGQFRNETGIRTYLQKEWVTGSLSEELEVQIIRIIQEALWNIRKHSQAKTVRLMLRHEYNGKYYILIEDDGVGISSQVYGSPGEHVGLTIMRERAERIGGTLRVESEPGEGTRVVFEFDDPDNTRQ